MSKIFVQFSLGYDFVLFDPEQGILRKKGKDKLSPVEVNKTSFVQSKMKEGLLFEAPKRSKDR